MGTLKIGRHEIFAQYLAQGKTTDEAYKLAGFNQHRSNAARLRAKEPVRARVEELLNEAAERCGVTVDKIISELAKIGFANSADFFEWGPDGVRIKSSDSLTRDQTAVISEVQETRSKGPGENTIKIKLSDKQGALEKLGRHLGMFKERVEIAGKDGGPVQTQDVSARELIAGRISSIAERKQESDDTSRTLQ